MEKYKILFAYTGKQLGFIERISAEVVEIDLSIYEKQFVFALRVQQLYTAIEDLFKQTAKAFENHIEILGNYHKELLLRMEMEIPNIRPRVISHPSFLFLEGIAKLASSLKSPFSAALQLHIIE